MSTGNAGGGISSRQAIILAIITGFVTLGTGYISILPQLRDSDAEQQLRELKKIKDEYEAEIKKLQANNEVSSEVVKNNSISSTLPVGTIVNSILTYSEFCEAVGQTSADKFDAEKTIWAPADGRSCRGSRFAEMGYPKVPDLRGVFVRSMNSFDRFEEAQVNGRQADPDTRKLGSFQPDEFASHTHTYSAGSSPYTEQGTGGVPYLVNPRDKQTTPKGGNETRPKNISLNRYIKIN